MMKRKFRNLQPWLDYFGMLQTYEQKGLLDVQAGKGEALVVLTALLSLSCDGDDASVDLGDPVRLLRGWKPVLRRLRAYAGWKSCEGKVYLGRPFAMHVVGDDAPHDPVCTLLLERRRRWWSLWTMVDCVEVIDYTGGGRKP